MRIKKATTNVSISIITYLFSYIPMFIVRKIFLEQLGTEMLGLSSLFSNIIGYFSIIELGIGSAIIFSLYKPFQEKNYIKVNGYLGIYSKFYKTVGILILILGMLFTPFMKYFINDNIDMLTTNYYFILFLINTVISYLFSYKLCILNVAQENYIVSLTSTISKLIISMLQSIMLLYFPNFSLYIIIQIAINLIYYILINKYIDKRFKFIKESNGVLEEYEKSQLIKNVKALFFHKIGGVIVLGTDNLVISTFINLNTVAIYSSYSMVINAIKGMVDSAMNSITPSIGNLLTQQNKEYAYKAHKRLFLLNFWISSFIVITLYNTITQFINIWLGNSQIMDNFTLTIILINLYFQLMRSSIEKFKDGSGTFYQDRYAPLIESVINLIASIILVNKIGLAGVFIGTLISNVCVIFWTKPLVTYKYVFEKSVLEYFKIYFKYLLIGMIPLLITILCTKYIKINNNIFMLFVNGLINTIIINSLYIIIFWRNDEFIYFKNIIIKFIKRFY